ncbi:MAG: sporulation protein YtfJ [Oscillospiraceae bacterium]|jgi:sporulation protein YtfJ|nr:sporulation protein YtfJ [Oscillospiraceae bacterium]
MNNKINDIMSVTMNKIKEITDVETIVGDPIKVDEKTTLIPVSKASFGFVAGGSDIPAKIEKERFGGGTGAGVSIQPVAFIVINDGNVRMMSVNSPSSAADLIPELFTKISDIIETVKKNKENKTKTDTHSSNS